MCDSRRLDWDSEFFHLNVYRLDFSENCDLASAIKELYVKGADLIYVFSEKELNDTISGLNGMLVDIKVIFEKKVIPFSDEANNAISIFNGNKADDQLYDLAHQSGIESRFKKDTRLPAGSFQLLYNTWLEKSLSHELADAVFISTIENSIVGFITVKIKSGRGEVGLFAVDEKYRGRNIGKSLLRRAEKYVLENRLDTLMIPTQETNEGASRFYRSNGYKIIKRTFIYHFIKKPANDTL